MNLVGGGVVGGVPPRLFFPVADGVGEVGGEGGGGRRCARATSARQTRDISRVARFVCVVGVT